MLGDTGKISTAVLGWTLGAVAAAGILATAVAAWSLAAPPTEVAAPSASAAPTAPATIEEPAVFIGDELDWLLLPPEAIQQLLPQATGFVRSSIYGHAGESEGVVGEPIVCMPFVFEDPTFIVGYRMTRWEGDGAQGLRQVSVRQFPTQDAATVAFEQITAAAAGCSDYRYADWDEEPPMHFTVTSQGEQGGTFYVVGERTSERTEWWDDTLELRARHGNVLISMTSPIDDGRVADEALVAAVLAQVEQARLLLAEQNAG